MTRDSLFWIPDGRYTITTIWWLDVSFPRLLESRHCSVASLQKFMFVCGANRLRVLENPSLWKHHTEHINRQRREWLGTRRKRPPINRWTEESIFQTQRWCRFTVKLDQTWQNKFDGSRAKWKPHSSAGPKRKDTHDSHTRRVPPPRSIAQIDTIFSLSFWVACTQDKAVLYLLNGQHFDSTESNLPTPIGALGA